MMARMSGITLLIALSACSAGELPDGGDVYLRPSFYTGGMQTRSIVNGTSSTGRDGNINKVKLYVTNNTGNAVYTAPGLTGGLSEYTYDGTTWKGSLEIKLSNVEARIYAFYPETSAVTAGAGGADTHTIPVSVTAGLTFDGGNEWNCNQVDYLYGSASSTTGDAQPVTASNASGKFEPAIHMQHALAQVVFKMQTASGRPVDDTYDYVKQLTLKATTSLFMTGTNGTMLLKDGTLQSISTGVKELTFKPNPDNTAVKCGANGSAVVVGYGLVAPLASQPGNGTISLTVLLGKQGTAVTENERELTAVLSNPQWLKGNRYTYTITLSNRSMVVEKVTSEPIKGWDDVSGSGSLKPEGF